MPLLFRHGRRFVDLLLTRFHLKCYLGLCIQLKFRMQLKSELLLQLDRKEGTKNLLATIDRQSQFICFKRDFFFFVSSKYLYAIFINGFKRIFQASQIYQFTVFSLKYSAFIRFHPFSACANFRKLKLADL